MNNTSLPLIDNAMSTRLNKLRTYFVTLIVFAAIFMGWCFTITSFVDSGYLWKLLESRFASTEKYEVQNVLVTQASAKTNPIIIIGDPLFVDTVESVMPGNAEHLSLSVRSLDALDISSILKATQIQDSEGQNAVKAKLLIVQLSPHFWTNSLQRGSAQTFRYWEVMNTSKVGFLPNDSTKIFFSMFEDWSRLKTSDTVVDRISKFNDQTQFNPNPKIWDWVENRLRNKAIPIIFVPDRRNMDFSEVPELLAAFNSEVPNIIQKSPKIGGHSSWVELDDLANTLQKLPSEK